MHNLAIALKQSGHQISGSDDVINDPSRSRLKKEGLLPENEGWDASRIHGELDLVIVGMHARKDNPELLEAQRLNLPVESFPEFVANQSRSKKRIVIAGSHGKTTSTGMMMKALETLGVDFDYLVGSQLDGYDCMVRMSDAPLIVIEGDEYLTSPLDLTPKFWWYRPHLSMITGIAWDHINVFPEFESYVNAFSKFADLHEDGGTSFYFSGDQHLKSISADRNHMKPYSAPVVKTRDHQTVVEIENETVELNFFGQHNIENASGVVRLLGELGFSELESWRAVSKFKGTARRMEFWTDRTNWKVIRDFAHSPSKVTATTSAVREEFPEEPLLAIYELHTFSSLQAKFMSHYKGALDAADQGVVYVDDRLFSHRKLPRLSDEEIRRGFGSNLIIRDPKELQKWIDQQPHSGVWLLMSSGTFSGVITKDRVVDN
jgi:UDP-N-acetylmuramate: L-alanyl-gamma-D-glutamyl-meso-diaminopimelate ligase